MRTLAARAIADCEFHSRLFDELFASAVPLEEALKGMTVPTLIQWGDRDRLLHVSGASILHALLPGSQLQVMHNIGHVPMQEAPRDAAQAFMIFQAGLASRAATPAPTSLK
jgi:pimeloyl-ACP methyl ester carboxylesterase